MERRDSAGTVIQEEEVHRKDGVSHPVGAALLHTEESLRSNKPGLTVTSDRIPVHWSSRPKEEKHGISTVLLTVQPRCWQGLYMYPPQVLIWMRNMPLKCRTGTIPWFLWQSCLRLSRLGCFETKPNGKRRSRSAPDVLQTLVVVWPQDQARLLWSKAISFTHTRPVDVWVLSINCIALHIYSCFAIPDGV